MHFWIDKTSFNSREFSLYRNIRSKSPFPHHHRNRQSINSHNSHTIAESSHNQPSASRNTSSRPSYGYIIAMFHVKFAICISIALCIFIFKLYKDGSISKFQIVLFGILSTVFIFCILIGYVFYGSTAPPTTSSRCPSQRHSNGEDRTVQIEVQDFPPAYGVATQCPSQLLMPPRDDPPSYSQLFEV